MQRYCKFKVIIISNREVICPHRWEWDCCFVHRLTIIWDTVNIELLWFLQIDCYFQHKRFCNWSYFLLCPLGKQWWVYNNVTRTSCFDKSHVTIWLSEQIIYFRSHYLLILNLKVWLIFCYLQNSFLYRQRRNK